jgi:hypothetical protein
VPTSIRATRPCAIHGIRARSKGQMQLLPLGWYRRIKRLGSNELEAHAEPPAVRSCSLVILNGPMLPSAVEDNTNDELREKASGI